MRELATARRLFWEALLFLHSDAVVRDTSGSGLRTRLRQIYLFRV